MVLVEYSGGNRRAFIILPEGREGNGGESCTIELQEALSFFQFSCCNGFKVQSSSWFYGGQSSSGVGGSTSSAEVLAITEVGRKRTYAKVQGRPILQQLPWCAGAMRVFQVLEIGEDEVAVAGGALSGIRGCQVSP